jgi:hypothetical protein
MSLFSDVFSLPVHFEFFAICSYCLHFVFLLKRLQRLKQEGRNVQLGPGKQTEKTGLVWRNRKKISQIIKDYFYYRSSSFLFYTRTDSQREERLREKSIVSASRRIGSGNFSFKKLAYLYLYYSTVSLINSLGLFN